MHPEHIFLWPDGRWCFRQTDHFLWLFLAYCTGTGGSILIIGSAAGVAAMGIEKIDFIWYIRKIGWLAAIGYFAGAGVFLAQVALINSKAGVRPIAQAPRGVSKMHHCYKLVRHLYGTRVAQRP